MAEATRDLGQESYWRIALAWSNGQTEGQVNRLKLVKGSMYGRAGFNLLRARVLSAG
jgi:transposase